MRTMRQRGAFANENTLNRVQFGRLLHHHFILDKKGNDNAEGAEFGAFRH